MKNIKTTAFRMIMVLLTITLILVICEIFSRIFLGYMEGGYLWSEFTYDEHLGWKGKPCYKGIDALGNNISINEFGYRDDSWIAKLDHAEKLNLKKILFIGDSYSYGLLIPKEHRTSEQLAKVFTTYTKEEIATFNAGIFGWGTDQEYRALESLIPLIKPDVVVVEFCRNDFGNVCLPYDYNSSYRIYKPFYDQSGNLVLNSKVPKRFSSIVEGTFLGGFKSKYLIERIQYFFQNIQYAMYGVSWNIKLNYWPPIYHARYNAYIGTQSLEWTFESYMLKDIYERNKARNFNLWKKMKRLCGEYDANFIFLFAERVGNSKHEKELLRFLEENKIAFASATEIVPKAFWDYDYPLGASHANFIANYGKSLSLYNLLEGERRSFSIIKSPWLKEIPSKIIIKESAASRYLFGAWYDIELDGRWMGREARIMLRFVSGKPTVDLILKIYTHFTNRTLTVEVGDVLRKIDIPKDEDICIKVSIPNKPTQEGVFLLTLRGDVSYPFLETVSKDSRGHSFFLKEIELHNE